MALTVDFIDVHPLKQSANPLPFRNKIVDSRQKEGNTKTGSERGVQWERKQTKSHRHWM